MISETPPSAVDMIHPATTQLYPTLPLADHKGSICSYEEVKIFSKSQSEPNSINILEVVVGHDIKNDSCHKNADVPVVISAVKPLPAERKKPVPAPRSNTTPHELASQPETGMVSPSVKTPTLPESVQPSQATRPASVTICAVTAGEISSGVLKQSSSASSPFSPTVESPGRNNSFDDECTTNGPQFPLRQISKSVEQFGPIGSRQASVKWFKSTQAKFLLQIDEGKEKNDKYLDWFHGIITRKEAEALLGGRPTGSFLVRVGESRLGYTLSFKDKDRCRHYMIDYLSSEDSFQVVGETTLHMSLPDLVNFYRKNKLANWEGRLTSACPQNEGECDYLELVITADEEQKLNYICNKPRLEATAPVFDDDTPNNSWSIGPTPLHREIVTVDSKPPLVPPRDPSTLPQRIAPPSIIFHKKYPQPSTSSTSTVASARSNRPLPPAPVQGPPLPPARARIH